MFTFGQLFEGAWPDEVPELGHGQQDLKSQLPDLAIIKRDLLTHREGLSNLCHPL